MLLTDLNCSTDINIESMKGYIIWCNLRFIHVMDNDILKLKKLCAYYLVGFSAILLTCTPELTQNNANSVFHLLRFNPGHKSGVHVSK